MTIRRARSAVSAYRHRQQRPRSFHNPILGYRGTGESVEPERIPDPIEFVVSDRYLNRPNLYPRQATVIKTIFLRDDLFTQYDYDVLGEWEETFQRTGNEGCSPNVLERIKTCQEQNRPWFRESLMVVGRRGSKGYTGGVCGSYVLWNYMNKPGGPQEYYGIAPGKQLTGIVFAGKKEQARDNQWQDLNDVIVNGPCFGPYISRPLAQSLTVFSPFDFPRIEELEARGISVMSDLASFEIVPSASTMMAGRGPTSFMQFYDEMAHVVATGANRDAEAVYTAATPSLDQFGVDAFIYEPSSPWQMIGQFFTNWEKAIEVETGDNGEDVPAYPEMFMLQLPSWGPYEDWEEADRIPLVPPKKEYFEITQTIGGVEQVVESGERSLPTKTFKPLKRAMQAYDDQMRQLEKANPETFAVERRSHWAESLAQYLNRKKVEEMFTLPFKGRNLVIQTAGALGTTYMAHGDPATSNKRFGWALGHREWDEDMEMFHVVADVIRCWEPGDYDDHIIDYDVVMDTIEDDVKNFVPEDVSFDQFNVPATIGRLRKFVAKEDLPKHVEVREVTRTAPLNWRHFELFKSAVNMGLVHAPMNKADGEVNYASEQAELELRFLEEKNGKVDHPSSGPVQSKDIADALVEMTVSLIGEQMATFLGQELADIGVSGSPATGLDPQNRLDPEGSQGAALGQALAASMGGAARSRRGAPGSPARGMRRR